MIDTCPFCKVSLQGPETSPGSGQYYSEVIGVQVRGVYDGELFFQCPGCHGRWHRFEPGHWLYDKAEPYVRGER